MISLKTTTWGNASVIILLSGATLRAIASLWVPINFSTHDACRDSGNRLFDVSVGGRFRRIGTE